MVDKRMHGVGFMRFMVSSAGRWLRIVVGALMIVLGLLAQTTAGYIVAVVGVVPFLAGALDFCILAPLLGAYFDGHKTRMAVGEMSGDRLAGTSP